MRGRRCRCATHAYFQQHVPIERKIFNCVKEMVVERVCATEFHGKLSTATHPADVVAAIPVTSPSRVSRAAPQCPPACGPVLNRRRPHVCPMVDAQGTTTRVQPHPDKDAACLSLPGVSTAQTVSTSGTNVTIPASSSSVHTPRSHPPHVTVGNTRTPCAS